MHTPTTKPVLQLGLSTSPSFIKEQFYPTVYIVLYLVDFICKTKVGNKDVNIGKVRVTPRLRPCSTFMARALATKITGRGDLVGTGVRFKFGFGELGAGGEGGESIIRKHY